MKYAVKPTMIFVNKSKSPPPAELLVDWECEVRLRGVNYRKFECLHTHTHTHTARVDGAPI